MAGSPKFKIYRDGKYIGCTKYAEDAAALVNVSGGVVKHEHRTVLWTEGSEDFSAGESYDGAAEIMERRLKQAHIAAYDKLHGYGAAARVLAERAAQK